jgi:hypothetical protein
MNMTDCDKIQCAITCFEAAREKTESGKKKPDGGWGKFFNHSASKSFCQ